MDLFFATLEAVLLLITIGVLGFIIVSRKLIPESILRVLNPLILDISLPSLIFFNILSRFEPEKMAQWWQLPLWWVAFTIFTLGITLLLTIRSRENKGELSISLLYPNYVFFPLALIPAMFGSNSPLLVELFILTAAAPPFVFNSYHLFFKKNGIVKFNLRKAFNPVLIATVAAITIKLSGLSGYVPKLVFSLTKTIGAVALPLIMIVIGGSLYVDFQRKGRIFQKETILFVLAKNLLFPVLTLMLLNIINPPASVATILFILSASPPLTAVTILAEKSGGNYSLVNQCILGSFAASIVTIPLMMLLFQRYFISA